MGDPRALNILPLLSLGYNNIPKSRLHALGSFVQRCRSENMFAYPGVGQRAHKKSTNDDSNRGNLYCHAKQNKVKKKKRGSTRERLLPEPPLTTMNHHT